MRIGFLGLGNMGAPMAGNLLKAGFDVAVWNRTRSRADALAAQGAAVAASPAEAAQADVVFTMLADDKAVEAVVLGSGGVLGSIPAGAVHVSSSTISVALADRLAEAHADAGSRLASAPVFGRPEAAAAAKLFVVAAGADDALSVCRPALDAVGQRVFVVGTRPSAANVVKLSGNFLIASMIECLGEAFSLVRKAGVEPAAFLDVLTNSLFNAPVYHTYGAAIAERRFQPAGFKLPLGLKDMTLVLAAAQDAAVPMPAASLVHDRMLAGMAQGLGEADWSALAEVVMRNAGL